MVYFVNRVFYQAVSSFRSRVKETVHQTLALPFIARFSRKLRARILLSWLSS